MHVAFIAFNRPEHLSPCLEAIRDQVKEEQVYLFQDGPKTDSDAKAARENERLFVDAFRGTHPDIEKRVVRQPTNLGAELHFIAMFEHLFEKCAADEVLHVEDDIVVESIYIEQLNLLSAFCKQFPEIVAMSCWGLQSRDWDEEEMEERRNDITPMHNWCGSLWRRKAWTLLYPYLRLYRILHRKFIREWDSNDKVEFRAVLSAFLEIVGIYDIDDISSDAYIAKILTRNGLYRVTTAGRYLQHIGSYGVNAKSKEENYERFGKYSIESRLVTDFRFDPTHRNFRHIMAEYMGPNWRDNVKKIKEEE
jgi:glycosyltransferase involved in cell wall biosynthesis